jgi:DNA-binding response OmpR family regulator
VIEGQTSGFAPLEWRSSLTAAWISRQNGHRLLIVDDDLSLQTLLRILLTSSGYDVVTANDGKEALGLIEAHTFDIILLDLEMPVMNGRDFFREFRRRDADTPVVIISAFGAADGQRELGAQGSIAKPFDPASVHRLIELILSGQA